MTDGPEEKPVIETNFDLGNQGTMKISCKKIEAFDDKVTLVMDENTLPNYKTIAIKIGKKTYTFKQQ